MVANSLLLPDAVQAEAPSSRLAWVLFLVVNAALFMRPAEIVPELEGWPIYNVLILSCLAVAAPLVIEKLRGDALTQSPITICVLGMLPAVVFSLLVQGDTWNAREWAIEFSKVIIYYMLLVTLVRSPRRMSQFMIALALFSLVLNVVALLSYHKIIDLATVAPMEEAQFQEHSYDDREIVVRLQAAGIYGNPNDLARIIAVGITVCFFALARKRSIAARLWWLLVLATLTYAMRLTYSRGGLLGLIAGILVLFHARYGMRRGGRVILLLLPVLAFFGGRQTDIETSSGTGQLRIRLWSEGLVALRSSPVFGIGTDHYFRTAGNHAHNSFIEAYVETGLLGGTCFTGAFFLATMGLYRLKSREMEHEAPELWRMRPYVLSLVVGTMVGQLSSSREYSQPTYMILGLAASYLALAARCTPSSAERISSRLTVRIIFVSICALILLHFYTKFNARFN
jgi:O-antigen ligase